MSNRWLIPCLCFSVRRSFSNAAFKRKTEQYDRANSSRMVVDGDFNSWSELGRVQKTWWKVDLGREGLVTGVRFVLKLASNGSNIESCLNVIIVRETGKIKESLCATFNIGDIVENEVAYKVSSCGTPLLGRFVRVEMTMEGRVECSRNIMCPSPVMNLYEVEVMMGKDIGSFREIFFQLYVLCRPINVHFSSFALEVAQNGFLSFFPSFLWWIVFSKGFWFVSWKCHKKLFKYFWASCNRFSLNKVITATLKRHVITLCNFNDPRFCHWIGITLSAFICLNFFIGILRSVLPCSFVDTRVKVIRNVAWTLLRLSFIFPTVQSTGFIYINTTSPRVKGEKARMMTRYILPRYNCLSFSYHIYGSHIGRLNVYFKSYESSEILLWRLHKAQSNNWHHGEILIQTNDTFQVWRFSWKLFSYAKFKRDLLMYIMMALRKPYHLAASETSINAIQDRNMHG